MGASNPSTSNFNNNRFQVVTKIRCWMNHELVKDNLLKILLNTGKQGFRIRVRLHWSESERERDITWNGYIDFLVVCLYLGVAKIKEIFAFAFAFAPI